MLSIINSGSNPRFLGKQYRGGSKLRTEPKATTAKSECPVKLTPAQEIEQIKNAEYRRHRLGDREVYLLPLERLVRMGDKGASGLSHNPDPELKFDMGRALAMFSPAERRIILRVYVQGQSIDVATRGSKKSRSYWEHFLRTVAIPRLRDSLKDYAPGRNS